jgi:thiamine-phosphate pyrophosphorylase
MAQDAGIEHLHPGHLFHALLEDPEGRPAVVLSQFGAGSDPIGLPHASELDGTATDAVFDRARDLAGRSSRDRIVGTEHLLLAILEADALLRNSLENAGLDFVQLQKAIIGETDTAVPMDTPLQLIDRTDEMDLARIIDVGANRVREALRVIEDYCRFVLDDSFLCRLSKELRHRFLDVIARLANHNLEARDTTHDVGTTISTESEQHRSSLQSVLSANFKRLQESLRSLEEYGKLANQRLAPEFERLRYESYTLERAVVMGTTARQRLVDARLYVLLSSEECQSALDWTIQESAAGGAQIIQLREMVLSDSELLDIARRVRQWTRKAGVLFIVNNRPDIARLVDADGVHLGQEDMPVREARRIIGPDALVGVSTHDLEQIRRAVLDGASYIGVGPTFHSQTKEFDQFPGLDFVRAAAAETTLPAFAIGGIGPSNIADVIEAGIRRVAVGSAISKADDPRIVAAELRRVLDAG